jgi:DNA-binding NarL/FixJ family response regulator
VKQSERARLRNATMEERLDLWPGLVDGRWSIIESIESDGKRSLLLCRNEPRTVAVRSLTTRERAVVQRAVLGHPFKFIAYDLGLPVSTVADVLRTSLRKLGVGSRTDLIRLFNHVAPQSLPEK